MRFQQLWNGIKITSDDKDKIEELHKFSEHLSYLINGYPVEGGCSAKPLQNCQQHNPTKED